MFFVFYLSAAPFTKSYYVVIMSKIHLLLVSNASETRVIRRNTVGNKDTRDRCNVASTRFHSAPRMATPRYTLDTTLPAGHSNSITALEFSPDGMFLASGSGDGVIMIFSTSTWRPIKRFVDASSVTAVIWHPNFPKTFICGYWSGDVHTVNFESHLLVCIRVTTPLSIVLITSLD